MANRLPTVGGDNGNWGTVLNNYLNTAHNADGTLKIVASIKDYGAIGDGTTDDSVAIQSAIDTVSAAGGGTIICPPSTYKANVVLKQGVFLLGTIGGRGYLAGASPVSQTKFLASATGVVIDTPSGYITNCGVIGINIQGLGAGTPCKGIRFQNVGAGVVDQVHVNNMADEGVLQLAGGACTFEDIQIINAVLNRARASVIGAVDISGTDHYFSRVESTISGSIEGRVQSVNLYCVAFALRATNCFLDAVIGEISDIGIYVSGTANRLSNCRADLNYGHGFQITGSNNQFSNCLGLSNSQDTTNTYDNWQATSSSVTNLFANCRATDLATNKAKYGFEDLVSSATGKNYYINCFSNTALTAQYINQISAGSAFSFPNGGQKTLTVNSTTPDVTGYGLFITANSSPTTITDFTGGVSGQAIDVFCNDSNTTIQHNGSTITLFNVGNKKLVAGQWYRFQRTGGTWREQINVFGIVSADNGDTAKTLQSLVNEQTQQWASPLTINRAVTLSTTGAWNGAKFHIVRTVAATGAFTLDVGTGPLKSLAAGQWCDVEYNGSAWMLTAFGSL